LGGLSVLVRKVLLNKVLVFALVPGVLLVTACGGSIEAEQPAARGAEHSVRIIAEPVRLTNEAAKVEAVGTARAERAATIFPETSGLVTSVNFVSGQYVEKGAVLAQLDNVQQRLAVAKAEIALKDAQQLLERYQRIDVPGAVSTSQIDAAKTAVEAAKVDLDVAKELLADRVVRAPFSGYVGFTDIDAGARVTQSTEITRIDDRDVLFVDFSLPEQLFGQIETGSILHVDPFASVDARVEAEVTVVGSRINVEQRSFTVRAAIDNSADVLRPGMSFRVSFDVAGDAYPEVPEASIVWGGDGPYLWAVEDGKAKRMPVTIINRKEGRVLVRADLQEGDLIIAEGVQKVRDGTPVMNIVESRKEISLDVPSGAVSAQGALE
tara:strand:+ start:1428 stop:2567 length:1140 start_codon:yes stop_codon:yes gene_type:complete